VQGVAGGYRKCESLSESKATSVEEARIMAAAVGAGADVEAY